MTAEASVTSLPHQDVPPMSASAARTPSSWYGRLIGALFLAGFITYGTGSVLVSSVTGPGNFLPGVAAHPTTLILGAFLMLLNTAVDIGKGVLFFPIAEPHGKRTALTYVSAMIFEVALLAVGALCLLSLVPLSDEVGAGRMDGATAASLGHLALDANTMAYQIAQAGLAFGAFFLCVLLYRARLVPRFLGAWGAVGYVLHFAGASAEIFGIHISQILLVPGGLFELTLAFWLLVKGLPARQTVPGQVMASS